MTRRSSVNRARNAWQGLAAAFLLAGSLACGDYGGGAASSGGGAPNEPPDGVPGGPPPVVPGDPAAGTAAFASTVYPLLDQYCSDCHAGSGPGSPHVAHPNVETAYHQVVDNQKVNLSTPSSSRLVRRLVADFHHCWSSCMEDGMAMQLAIAAWAEAVVQSGGGTQVDDGLTSGAVTLAQGVEDLGAERYSEHLVAFFDFKEGSGIYVHDTSGIEPAINLTLQGETRWLSNYGVAFEGGKASAQSVTSNKLYEHIAKPNQGTQQYSVEAWVIPDNVTQEGPARIINYSSGTSQRNFGLGQVLYTYDYRNRNFAEEVDDNGSPSLRTYDADEDLQATLQHVVLTYDQFRGRRIYVNGRFTDDVDPAPVSRLWNWDPNYLLVLGNETSNNRPWLGKIQLVAIYDHALTDAQIQQNWNAGVGKRLILRFDISQWVGAGSFLEFAVSELDDYSYLFCEPTIVTPNPNGFRLSNLRVAVNGVMPVSGQAFVKLDQIVTATRQRLASGCSIVPKDQGQATDVFTLEFEVLGSFENPVPVVVPPLPPPGAFEAGLPQEGLRDFARILETMAVVTGVDPNLPEIRDTFEVLEQQLPQGPDLRAFSSSQQVGISKLALEFCDRLVETPALRTQFFGAFDFGAPATSAFASGPQRDQVIVPLVQKALGENLALQPSLAEASLVLNELMDDLTAGCTPTSCDAERTRTVVKAACAATLASGAASIH